MAKVLLIDPDENARREAQSHLEATGYRVFDTADLFTAELLLEDMAFDVVVGNTILDESRLLDLVSGPVSDGPMALLILKVSPDTEKAPVDPVSGAAFDYIQAPVELLDLERRVERALNFKRLHYEAQSLRGERDMIYRPQNFVGESAAIQTVLSLVSKVAIADSSVLLTGETGTGKELIAGSIHYNSGRAGSAFVKVNCAALPDDLLESELFGHEKGAFTGAVQSRVGRFEQADGGSIFLDEIGDMTLATQAKVLRVLQEKEFERLGGTQTITSDVRVISATNKDLPAAIMEGTFRQDLFYRLNVITIRLPPLRERDEDVVPLAHFFVRKFAADLKKPVRTIHPLAIEVLKDHSYPGNVRELQNIIERAVLMADGDEIQLSDLGLSFKARDKPSDQNITTVPPSGFNLKQVEKTYILQALRLCDWNQKKAAGLLNLSPRALNYKIKNHGIKHPSWSQNKPKSAP